MSAGLCCKEPLLLSISCAVLVCRNNTGRRHNNSPREGEILEKQLKVKFMGGRVVVSRCSLCAVCRRRAIHPSLTSFIHSEVVVVLQQNDALLLLCVDKYYKHSREWPLSVSSVAGCDGQLLADRTDYLEMHRIVQLYLGIHSLFSSSRECVPHTLINCTLSGSICCCCCSYPTPHDPPHVSNVLFCCCSRVLPFPYIHPHIVICMAVHVGRYR